MTSFTIQVDDAVVRQALAQLAQRVSNLQPVLQDIGEGIVERAQARFQTSTGPDGQRWAPNSAATLMQLIGRVRKSKGSVNKAGDLNAKGLRAVGAKKPLIGETGGSASLRAQIVALADRHSMVVLAKKEYAAIQQFGGQKSEFPQLWGDIPARPFLPIRQDGSLYPADQAQVLELLNDYLAGR